MSKYCLLIFLCFSFLHCKQEKSIEEIYQECVYSKLSDGGKAIKRYTEEFEQFLIKEGVLEDSTSKSYYNLYKSFAEGKRYNSDNFAYAYSDSINKNKEDRLKLLPINKECAEEIKKHKKFELFKNQILSNASKDGDKGIRALIKDNLHVIEKRDFTLDYYKQRTFALLYLLEEF